MNCYVSKDGGVFYLTQTTFLDQSSDFKNNAAIYGGAINCNECEMAVIGTQFSNNIAYTGGAVYLQKSAHMSARLVKFYMNKAFKEAGGVYVTQSSYFDLRDC